jgi:D-glucosaminate-6-phosphate ammonia-lyase
MDMDVSPQTWSPPGLIDRQELKGIPHHGIGRGFKVGKEEIAGLVCALERFVARDEVAHAMALTLRLQAIADALARQGGITTRLVPATEHAPIPLLELDVGPRALAIIGRLHAGTPPVHVGERLAAAGVLTINPQTLRVQDDATLARCLLQACGD